MNKTEIRKLAVKSLNTKSVQNIKRETCNVFIDKKQKKDCMTEFDKGFIKSFISSFQTKMYMR
jgi:hypothetical protein